VNKNKQFLATSVFSSYGYYLKWGTFSDDIIYVAKVARVTYNKITTKD
jgi:hypothetical protein